MIASLLLLITLGQNAAGQILLPDAGITTPGTDNDTLLQYDDGTGVWLTWEGTYRGVWFDAYSPVWEMLSLDYAEFWMYHDVANYQWDTSSFYAEVWTGDYMAPLVCLDEQEIVAVHAAPVYAYYSSLWPDWSFWLVLDTSLSTGGWPSVFVDGTPATVDHSFYSDDFFVWEPWSDTGDYLIRAGASGWYLSLEQASWGSIKAVF